MLLFITATTPRILSQTSQDSIAAPDELAQTQRPKLSMVWRKEFDGTRERLTAHWVVDG